MQMDALVSKLDTIAASKEKLPFPLRGCVSALGLHVQRRRAGGQARLQAGGKFRSYLDAWSGADGGWDVRAFDTETWDRRFSHLVDPTDNIAEYLYMHTRVSGKDDLDPEEAASLKEAVARFKVTGEWTKLL